MKLSPEVFALTIFDNTRPSRLGIKLNKRCTSQKSFCCLKELNYHFYTKDVDFFLQISYKTLQCVYLVTV